MEKEKSIAVMKDSCDRTKVERNDYDRTSITFITFKRFLRQIRKQKFLTKEYKRKIANVQCNTL